MGRSLEAVKKYLYEYHPPLGGPLFIDHFGRPWGTLAIRRRLSFWAKKLRFPHLSPHDFRRAYMTAFMAGQAGLSNPNENENGRNGNGERQTNPSS